MRDWRSTLISALALPTSVIATFFFMYIAGFTINMMTLMALSLVIGILIDDAVVVRENIYRHMEMGEDPMTAARNGTAQIGLAVMATTFTILAVFLPVGFMTGIVGQFFKSFALTIAFAVAMSLLVAFTLDPMLSSRFVRFIPESERTRTRMGRFFESIGHQYDKLDAGYGRVLRWSLARPWTVLAVAGGIFLASLSLIGMIGTEFVPDEDRGEFHVLVDLPPGTSFDQSVARVSQIEQTLGKIPEALQVFSTVGLQGEVRSADIQVTLTKKDQRKRGIAEIKAGRARGDGEDSVRRDPRHQAAVPAGRAERAAARHLRARRQPAGAAADQRRADDEDQADPGAVDIKSSLVSGQPEMVARINREMAADLGFDVGAIGGQLRGMVEGIVPTKLRDGDREHDIRVRLAPESRNDFATISRTPLYAPTGAVVRASDLVHLEPGVGPSSIDREQRRRQVKVGADLSGSRPLGDVSEDVQKALASVTMPANFEHGFAGDVELMQESAAAMGLAMILAVAFIYIVLASQFESFAEPMLIMLSLPLAVVGALLGLLFTGHHIGMPAMIGVVMLMGLVTKNAILLVDYTNQLHREEGLSVVDALLKAGPVRLRPIVMTTLAMILGMLPSAMGRGDGGEFRAPISVATIGGLITSTLLTLLVVPVSYLLLSRLLGWMRRKRTAEARLSPALRVTGAILLALLLGGLIAASNAFGGTLDEQQAPPDAPLALTFDKALEIALRDNNVLKVDKEVVHAAEGKVQEARANFLPTLDLSYSYTPAQQFPADSDSRGHLRGQRADVPGGLHAPEHHAAQLRPAALHRRAAAQQLRDSGCRVRRGARLAGARAAAADSAGRRVVLSRPAAGTGRLRRGRGRQARAAAAGSREDPLRGRHGGPLRRPARRSRRREREDHAHPRQDQRGHRLSGVAVGPVAANLHAADARRDARTDRETS